MLVTFKNNYFFVYLCLFDNIGRVDGNIFVNRTRCFKGYEKIILPKPEEVAGIYINYKILLPIYQDIYEYCLFSEFLHQ